MNIATQHRDSTPGLVARDWPSKGAVKVIELEITTYNLGALALDNEGLRRYRRAVQKRLEEMYPDAEVDVDYIEGYDKNNVRLKGFAEAGMSDPAPYACAS